MEESKLSEKIQATVYVQVERHLLTKDFDPKEFTANLSIFSDFVTISKKQIIVINVNGKNMKTYARCKPIINLADNSTVIFLSSAEGIPNSNFWIEQFENDKEWRLVKQDEMTLNVTFRILLRLCGLNLIWE
jgi:hypothetical protein